MVPKIIDLKFKSPVKEDATCVLPVALGCVHFQYDCVKKNLKHFYSML